MRGPRREKEPDMSPPAFETIMPEIEERSRRHYSHLDSAARDEAVQESVCQAFALYDSAVRRGNCRFTPCTLAWYANRAVDEGRGFAGYTTTDALDAGRAVGFDDLDAEGRSRIAEALVQRQTPVFDQARIRIDWPEFLRLELSRREEEIVTRLAEGWKRVEIARRLGLSPARMTQILGEVAEAYAGMFDLPGFERRARRIEKWKAGQRTGKPRRVA